MSRSLLFLLLHVISFAAISEQNAGVVTVVTVNGAAFSGDKRLQPGDKIPEGTLIRTEAASGVKLLLPDRSIMDIGPNSKLRVEKANKEHEISAMLELGSVRSSVQKKTNPKAKFTIRTKASVLAVRGTEFVVNVDDVGGELKEQVSVMGGEVVRLSSIEKETKRILPGQQLTLTCEVKDNGILMKEAPQVSRVERSYIAELLAKNTVEDRTFTREIEIKKDGPQDQRSGQGTFERVQNQFREDSAARGPASENKPPPGSFDPRREPPKDGIDPLARMSPSLAKGGVIVTISFNEQ
jgi:hypothetical protein